MGGERGEKRGNNSSFYEGSISFSFFSRPLDYIHPPIGSFVSLVLSPICPVIHNYRGYRTFVTPSTFHSRVVNFLMKKKREKRIDLENGKQEREIEKERKKERERGRRGNVRRELKRSSVVLNQAGAF